MNNKRIAIELIKIANGLCANVIKIAPAQLHKNPTVDEAKYDYDKYAKALAKKYNTNYIDIRVLHIDDIDFLAANGIPSVVNYDTSSIGNTMFSVFNFYKYDNKIDAFHIGEIFKRYLQRELIGNTNWSMWFEKNAELDKKETQRINEKYSYDVIRVYKLHPKIIAKSKKIFKDFQKELNNLQTLKTRLELAKKREQNNTNNKNKVVFKRYESWETGIVFYILKTDVDKRLFNELRKKAGLYYHNIDREMEEIFKGWTSRNKKAIISVLKNNGYEIVIK